MVNRPVGLRGPLRDAAGRHASRAASHANVDHFRWSWPTAAASARSRPRGDVPEDTAVAAELAGMWPPRRMLGAGETGRGRAYALRCVDAATPGDVRATRRTAPGSTWVKLLPSDRRAGDGFGFSVVVDDDAGARRRAPRGRDDALEARAPLRPVGKARAGHLTSWMRYEADYVTAFDSPTSTAAPSAP